MTLHTLRAAIVGAGLMGRWHAHYAARCGAGIAAVVDPDPGALQALRARHAGARGFSDLETCLAQSPVDVVHVCTPLATHRLLAGAALAAGKHVLVEKPLAETAADTRALLEQAERNALYLNPVHQLPFQPGVTRLRHTMRAIGKPVELAFLTCSAGAAGRAAAERRAVLFDILPHPLSLFRALLDADLANVRWHLATLTDDELDLAGDAAGVVLRTRISLRGRPTRNQLTVIGDRGTAHVDLFHGFSVLERGEPSRRTKLLAPFRLGGGVLLAAGANLARRAAARQYAYPGLGELIGEFYEAVSARGPAPISRAEVVEIAELVDRFRRS